MRIAHLHIGIFCSPWQPRFQNLTHLTLAIFTWTSDWTAWVRQLNKHRLVITAGSPSFWLKSSRPFKFYCLYIRWLNYIIELKFKWITAIVSKLCKISLTFHSTKPWLSLKISAKFRKVWPAYSYVTTLLFIKVL